MERLEINFVSEQSYHFEYKKSGRFIDFHLHLGKYNNDYLHIVINDTGILLTKDVKFLSYIDEALLEFGMKICDIFGFLNKDIKREIRISVTFNSLRINYAPIIYYDEEYEELMKNLSKIIFKKIEKLKKESIY